MSIAGPSSESFSELDLSPPIKRMNKAALTVFEKEALLNIYRTSTKWNETWGNKQHMEFTAEGIGVSTVYKTLTEYRKTNNVEEKKTYVRDRPVLDCVDDDSKRLIREKVHNFFRRNEPPSVEKVLQTVNEDPNLPSFKHSSFNKLLKEIGFCFRKRQRNSLLKEKVEVIAWRRRYLQQIKQYRHEGRKIYYMDETWINAGHTVGKVWMDSTVKSARQAFNDGLTTGLREPSGKGKRLIVTHIGSEDGFVPEGLSLFTSNKQGDYHREMNAMEFENWFQRILGNLEDNCVVVMDNAPYHSRQLEKVPTKSANKMTLLNYCKNNPAIIQYCQKNNIILSEAMLKAQICELINMHPKKVTYALDEIAKAQGKTVVRLPPYHCEFNPIELIWAQVKGYVASKNTTFKLQDVQKLFQEAVGKVTAQNWFKAIKHVEKVEQKMWEIDNIVDMQVQPLMISMESESEVSSDLDD